MIYHDTEVRKVIISGLFGWMGKEIMQREFLPE
jgi:hypothetical protein